MRHPSVRTYATDPAPATRASRPWRSSEPRCARADTVLELVDFDEVVAGADVLVTGEGSLDEQSLRGKTPIGVVRRASRLGVPVVAVCGRTTLDGQALRAAGFEHVRSLARRQPDPARSMAEAAELLELVGVEMAGALAALGLLPRRT